MPDLLAYCGLVCQTCPIYLATRQTNKEQQLRMRMEIIQLCKEHYGIQYALKDITDCDGCRTKGGRLFSTCRTCIIRKCAEKKGLENCGHCPDYACRDLQSFFETDPEAKTRLDDVRKGRDRQANSVDRTMNTPSSPKGSIGDPGRN